MKVHAIQTGFVRIKRAQVEGRGHGFSRRLAVFTDRHWTDWLPTYAWIIEHREGVIVVDTGQGAHLLETGRSLHPYVRWEVAFRIDPEEEIGPQMRALGIAARDVKRVILTHLHMDHDGGLAHFPYSEILVAPGELHTASGWAGRARGYLPHRWPSWFDPVSLDLPPDPFGPFTASRRLTDAGDVVAVATPGHTADHLSVLVQEPDTTLFLAGTLLTMNNGCLLAGWTASARMSAFPAQRYKRSGASPRCVRQCIFRRTIPNPLTVLRVVARLGPWNVWGRRQWLDLDDTEETESSRGRRKRPLSSARLPVIGLRSV
jgi:glyoxylase-like metal-dependent hydrolase (beta-lactamase superfamily II)